MLPPSRRLPDLIGSDCVATVVAALQMDRAGRRRLLLVGVSIMCVAQIVLGCGYGVPQLASVTPWVTLGGILGYVVGFSLSLGPIFWLMISEIYPLQVRGAGMALAVPLQWGANLLVSFTYLAGIAALRPQGMFWLFAFVCACCVAFIWIFVPETKGVSLEALERDLRRSESVVMRRALQEH